MGKLEEKILDKIKDKKEIKNKKKKEYDIYSLVSLVWMFVTPIAFGFFICKFFLQGSSTYISIVMGISFIFSIYNVFKIISDVYKND